MKVRRCFFSTYPFSFFANNYWKVGCFVFSLSVSIKMNVLLFAPGLLLLLLQVNEDLFDTTVHLAICGLTQVFLGAPFLFSYPESYLRKAFEFDRVFFYKWTVNWKFLDEPTFVSKPLSILLLVCHLSTLAYFAVQWLRVAQTAEPGQASLFESSPFSRLHCVHPLCLQLCGHCLCAHPALPILQLVRAVGALFALVYSDVSLAGASVAILGMMEYGLQRVPCHSLEFGHSATGASVDFGGIAATE